MKKNYSHSQQSSTDDQVVEKSKLVSYLPHKSVNDLLSRPLCVVVVTQICTLVKGYQSSKYHTAFGSFLLVVMIIAELKFTRPVKNSSALIGGEFIFQKKNPLRNLHLHERHCIITDHVIFKLCYTQIHQLKTTFK